MTYTDEQIDMYLRAKGTPATDFYRGYARTMLRRLADAGITLNFPEPRFYAASSLADLKAWMVYDRGGAGWLVKFGADNGHWNERQAKALAERLNREESV